MWLLKLFDNDCLLFITIIILNLLTILKFTGFLFRGEGIYIVFQILRLNVLSM